MAETEAQRDCTHCDRTFIATYARGRETFDATYAAFKSLLIGTWRRDALAAQTAAE